MEITTKQQFKDAQASLEDINMGFAKGEDLPGDDAKAEAIEQAMNNSPFKFDMDSGEVVQK